MEEDDRLTKALAHAHFKTTLVQQRENLKLRYFNSLLHAHNGGTFTVTPTLMCHVDMAVRNGWTDIILIDDKTTPINIADPAAFLEEIQAVYAEANNEYHAAWEALRKARSVEAVVKV